MIEPWGIPVEDYPNEDELAALRAWDRSPEALTEFIRDHWWMPSFGVRLAVRDEHDETDLAAGDPAACHWLYLSTGGWSGNEDRIEALQEPGRHGTFWRRYWYSSRVGGHYRFRVPVAQWQQPIDWFALPSLCRCDGAAYHTAAENRARAPFIVHPGCPVHAANTAG